MDLIIVQQGANLHYELQYTFLDDRLSGADRHAWAGLLNFIERTRKLHLMLPVWNLSRPQAYEMRNNIAGYFCNGKWVDLHQQSNELLGKLKSHHLDILPYLPNYSIPQIARYLKAGILRPL
jgi:hypothetical protein